MASFLYKDLGKTVVSSLQNINHYIESIEIKLSLAALVSRLFTSDNPCANNNLIYIVDYHLRSLERDYFLITS